MTAQIIKNFISENNAKFIVEHFSKNLSAVEDRPGFFEDLFIRKPIKFDPDIFDPNNKFETFNETLASSLINHCMYLAVLEIEKFYDVKINKCFGGMTKLIRGASHDVHSDTHHLDGTLIEDDPESKYIKYSALLYLSKYDEDFTGGILKFSNEDKEIYPEPGSLIFFESDHRNPHQVTEILSGERHSIIMFFGT